jgi:hypothetical protein
MGTPRHARPSDRFRAPLEGADRDHHPEVCSLAGRGFQQVLRLASPLRPGERAQRLGSPRLLVGGVGETGDSRLLRPLSPGRLSMPDLHDVGRRRGRGEPGERLASSAPSGPAEALEKQAVEQGQRLPATAGTASALACGHLLPQLGGDVLLPVQRIGRLQPLPGALGDSRVHDRGGSRDHLAAGAGAVPPKPRRGSSPTTARSSSPATSRSSFASAV